MRKFGIWLAVLAVVFLLGFVPQFWKARQFSQELQACRAGGQISDIRDQAAMVYLETNRKNFGVAGQHARSLFAAVEELAGQTGRKELQQRLSGLLETRDAITAGLAAGDAGVLGSVEELLLKTHEISVP